MPRSSLFMLDVEAGRAKSDDHNNSTVQVAAIGPGIGQEDTPDEDIL